MKSVVLSLFVFAATLMGGLTSHAQTAAIVGTNVVDQYGGKIASGQWCLGTACFAVTNGNIAPSSTVPLNTVASVTVSSAGTTVLTVPGVLVGRSIFNWNTYVVPSGVTISTLSKPIIACSIGAKAIETDNSVAWTCSYQGTTSVWLAAATAQGGSGMYAGAGVPTFTCTSPCLYIRSDASTNGAFYALQAPSGTQSNNWILQAQGPQGNPGAAGATSIQALGAAGYLAENDTFARLGIGLGQDLFPGVAGGIGHVSATNGSIDTSQTDAYFTPFIPMQGFSSFISSVPFYQCGGLGIAFYDVNQSFVSSISNAQTGLCQSAGPYTWPAGAFLFRASFNVNTDLSTVHVVGGTTMPSTVTPYASPLTVKGSQTVHVAAANTPLAAKNKADYVCSGSNDQTCINNVITASCPFADSGIPGCEIVLATGTYHLSGSISIGRPYVKLRGQTKPMWGGYEHSAGNTETTPVFVTAPGPTVLQNDSCGFDSIVTDESHTTGGGGGQRGFDLSGIMMYGYLASPFTGPSSYCSYNNSNPAGSQNNRAIYIQAADDWSEIHNMMISGYGGPQIEEGFDSASIYHNSIQGNGYGPSIRSHFGYLRTYDNLIYDNLGNAFENDSFNADIFDNIVGDVPKFVVSTGKGLIFHHNELVNGCSNPPCLDLQGDSLVVDGNYISGQMKVSGTHGSTLGPNTFDLTNAPAGGLLPVSPLTITSSAGVVAGGAFKASVLQYVPAIDATGSTGVVLTGATAAGFNSGCAPFTNPNGQTLAAASVISVDDLPSIKSACLIANWMASSTAGVGSGNTITSWPDSGGLGYNLVTLQGSPKYIASSNLNNFPAVRFNGTTDNIALANQWGDPTNQTRTIFIVFTPNANLSHAQSILTSDGSGQFSAYLNNGTVNTYTGVNVSGPTYTVGQPSVLEVTLNGTSSRISLNGVGNTFTSGTNAWQFGFSIGSNLASETAAVDVGQVKIYNGAMSSSDAALKAGALCSSYGITCGNYW